MTQTYHIREANHNGYSRGLCGQEDPNFWTWPGWHRDKRSRWCQKCVDLEPLAELSDTDL